jgi:Sulfotransferase family
VWLHSPEHGRAAEMATRLGVRVCDEQGLPSDPDALVVQDGIVSCELAAHYPLTPQLFVAHSDIFDLQLPPQLPGLVAVVVVLYERVQRRIEGLALGHEIVRLSQPIDVERFKPTRPLRAQPRVAVALGSYLHGERIEMLERACRRAGIEFRHVGAHSETGVVAAERVYDEADVVFGKARVILEAMACGRAAYVLDHNGGDGWVTAESYPRLAPDNFGGQTSGEAIDEDRLVADLRSYDAGMGLVNRDLAVAGHSASKHAAALADQLKRLVPRSAPVDAPLFELARLVRMYHRVDSQAFALYAENSRIAAQLHALEQQLERERAQHSEQLQAAEARAARRVGCVAAPAPFVVGVPRSGTTLLRFMLDSHSRLAIGPETGFGLVVSSGDDRDGLLDAVCALDTWPDLGLDSADARVVLDGVQPWSVGDGLRALYTAFATRAGKVRWGDKTPAHLQCMPAIAHALPEAHFIHVIRDGRDVAASLHGLPFAPDGGIEAIAQMWRSQILMGRAHGPQLAHYHELRYDRLVHEPEPVLRELCAFIDLDFEPSMLRPQDRAPERMAELAEVRSSGAATVTRQERMAWNAALLQAPDASRAGSWAQRLTAAEVDRFEAVAGDLLDELGYR